MRSVLKHIFFSIMALVFILDAQAQNDIIDTTITTTIEEVIPNDDLEDSYAESEERFQFKERITPTEVGVRKIPADELNATKADDDYWYVDEAPVREKQKVQQEKKSNTVFTAQWFKTLFWILLIGGFIALLVWFLATSNISLFRKKQKVVSDNGVTENETENIFEMNFEKEIQQAISNENYRLAVRLMYLRTLKDLSNRNLINYTHEKTNSDYLFHLAGSPYYKNFFGLTRSFDYTWYGKFPLSKEGFLTIQNHFSNFQQQLS